jgi:pyruvate-ferredoxin/flavodoxin oxidoreductase
LQDYIYKENRYRMLVKSQPEVAEVLLVKAQAAVNTRRQQYEQLAKEIETDKAGST